MKQQVITQKEQLSKLDTQTLANNSKRNDLLLGKLKSVTDGPDEGLNDRLSAAAQESVQQGLLDPQHAQAITQMASQSQDPKALKNQLALLEKGMMGQKEAFDQAQKERETAASESKAATEAQRLQLESQGVLGPAAGVDRQEMADWLSKNKGKGPADFMAYKAKLVPQFNFSLQGGGNAAPLSDTVVDALGAPGAKLKLADVIPARAPLQVKQAAIAQVLSKYPNFSSADYDLEKGVMKSAISGDIGKNLTAFNTAIDHAKQLQAATDALANGDVRGLNKIGNTLGYEFGSDKTTNFNVIKSALSGEISKVFKGGQATDAEIKEVQGPFDAANSPAQLRGAINQAISLMNSKRNALKEQVEQGKKGQANFGEDKPTASKVIYARDPSGKLHSAPAGTSLPAGWKQEQAP